MTGIEIVKEIERVGDLLAQLSRDLDALKSHVPIEMAPPPPPPPQPIHSHPRRSAGVDKLRIEINRSLLQSKVWRLTDIWTTINGSWETSADTYSIPQWARNEFARIFPMTGGDHNIYGIMLARTGDETVSPIREKMRFWHTLGSFVKDPKPEGYFEQDIFGSFNPETQRGGWSVAPQHPASDVVVGMGLPNNHHVSLFCVWRWMP